MDIPHSKKSDYTFLIKHEANRLGFDYCGISKAAFLEEEALRLETWLGQHRFGEMSYMENHFDKRLDPRLLVEGAKSVISLRLNYYPGEKQKYPDAPKISKYAFGNDYHFIIKEKLKKLLDFIKEKIGEVNGRYFVDSAPVLERAWAAKSGLGWIGKNSNLLNKNGSFYFLAEIIVDLEFEYDSPVPDYCGTCTYCMDACPTKAIIKPQVVDAGKCISYFTIEFKNMIPVEYRGKFENRAFGCDICQDVCPWNRFSKPHNEPLLNPILQLLEMNQKDWEELSEHQFKKLFRQSPLSRAGFKGMKRNIDFLK